MTGRVVEYATPEEIAPPHKVWGSREEKAVAEHEAAARRRLLDRLRRSKRWVPTDKPVTRKTLRQLEHERRERERRQIEAKLRAEYERQLEVELAKRSPVSESAATSSEQPEPVEESVKHSEGVDSADPRVGQGARARGSGARQSAVGCGGRLPQGPRRI